MVIIKKKDEKLEKNSLRARKDSRGVVQVLFRHGCPPCSVLRVLFIGFVLLRRAALGSGLWYHSRQTPRLVTGVFGSIFHCSVPHAPHALHPFPFFDCSVLLLSFEKKHSRESLAPARLRVLRWSPWSHWLVSRHWRRYPRNSWIFTNPNSLCSP